MYISCETQSGQSYLALSVPTSVSERTRRAAVHFDPTMQPIVKSRVMGHASSTCENFSRTYRTQCIDNIWRTYLYIFFILVKFLY